MDAVGPHNFQKVNYTHPSGRLAPDFDRNQQRHIHFLKGDFRNPVESLHILAQGTIDDHGPCVAWGILTKSQKKESEDEPK